MQVIVFLLTAIGLYALLTGAMPKAYARAGKAINARSPVKVTANDRMINQLADKIAPLIHIEPIKHARLKSDLQSVGMAIAPETFKSRNISRGIMYSLPIAMLTPVSIFMLICAVAVAWQTISHGDKQLKALILERKAKIERELPQFAGTIRQSLNNTRSIITIFESYRKVCGDNLRHEIEITLNDMRTGNTERALKAFDGRVSSAKLSQLIRGLIGLDRGEDVKVYFDMLAVEYQKAQNEAVKKELLERPSKLDKYVAALFVCLFIMVMLAIGMMVTSQMGVFFS